MDFQDIPAELIPALAALLLAIAALIRYELQRRQQQPTNKPENERELVESEWDVLLKLVSLAEKAEEDRKALLEQNKKLVSRIKGLERELKRCHEKVAKQVAKQVTQELNKTAQVNTDRQIKEFRNREIIRLRKEENLTHQKIADRIGCSRRTVGRVLSMISG